MQTILSITQEKLRSRHTDSIRKQKQKKSMVSYIILDRMKDVPETRDDGYFLYVGNMEKRKGVEILLAAYALYKKRGGEKILSLPESRMIIISDSRLTEPCFLLKILST